MTTTVFELATTDCIPPTEVAHESVVDGQWDFPMGGHAMSP